MDPSAAVIPGAPFRWGEFSGWQYATALQIARLKSLVYGILWPARRALGRLDISAGGWIWSRQGYPRTGVHASGAAVDFVPAETTVRRAYEWIRDGTSYGRVIYERDHVDVSLPGFGGDQLALLEDVEGSYREDPEGGPVRLGLEYGDRTALMLAGAGLVAVAYARRQR